MMTRAPLGYRDSVRACASTSLLMIVLRCRLIQRSVKLSAEMGFLQAQKTPPIGGAMF